MCEADADVTERRYLPAAGLDILLPVYDPIMQLLGFRRALLPLVEQAHLGPDHRVLDIGCGTGAVALTIKQRYPTIDVTGLDPDPLALARAARKTQRAGVAIRFDRGFADAMPYADGSFDRVFSSMMFHHLLKEQKAKVLAEVVRVLRPGGQLEFLDFSGGAHHSLLAHMLHGRRASAGADERLVARMRDAGFVAVERTGSRTTIAGAISYYQARRA
jgi:SAM-dependent methyltransferase